MEKELNIGNVEDLIHLIVNITFLLVSGQKI